jgi:membrane-associated phospholipid phosphatase
MTRPLSSAPAMSSSVTQHSTGSFAIRMGAGAGGFVLIVLAGIVMTRLAGWTAREMDVVQTVSRLHTAPIDALALGIDWLFAPPIAAAIVVVVAVLIYIATRRVGTALEFAVIVTGSWLGSEVIKLLVQRPRPDASLLAHPLITESSYGFPSGHTAFAASLAIGLIVLTRGRRWRPVVIAVSAIGALLVACSRVYMGVHYLSDVIASLVYSTIAVSLLAMLWHRFAAPRFASRSATSRGHGRSHLSA